MVPFRILVVDDEENLCEILRFNLQKEGYEVDTANSAEEALTLDLTSYHLFLLDVMMGEISGFQLASLLKNRKETAQIPTLFLTALDAEADIIKGFNLGADDYVTKPFSVKEVLLRVKAILKRTYSEREPIGEQTLSFGDLSVDLQSITATLRDKPIDLTKKELGILILLLQNIGKVFSREEILLHVWTDEVVVLDRTVDVNITRLRKKIGSYGNHIVTRVGFGYVFEKR